MHSLLKRPQNSCSKMAGLFRPTTIYFIAHIQPSITHGIADWAYVIGRAGASPPSRIYNRAEFSIYIRSTIHIAHARATGKRKAGSFQVQRSHVPSKLSRVVSSLSTTNHPCAWTVPTSAERLSVWKSPQETTTLCVFYS